MKITCMLIPHFFYQLHRFRDPYIIGHPVIIGDHFSGILDFSPEAEAAGIAINLSLNDALLLSPDAILLKPDYSYYEKQWDGIIDILINHTLIVEDAGLGCAYIKLNSNKYKENIDLFLKKISTLENNQRFNINWGVSNGKFYAFLSALYYNNVQNNNCFNITSISPAFLSSIPIDVLPISDHIKQKLLSFGMSYLSSIAEQNLGPMEAQFGDIGRRIWYLSRGLDDGRLTPLERPLVVKKTINFDSFNNDVHILYLALYQLIKETYSDDKLNGRFVRSVKLKINIYKESTYVIDIPLRKALGSYDKIVSVIKPHLNRINFTNFIESISVEFKEITGEVGVQNNFFENIRDTNNLKEAINQLSVLSDNKCPVYRIKEVNRWSKHPEERYVLVEYGK